MLLPACKPNAKIGNVKNLKSPKKRVVTKIVPSDEKAAGDDNPALTF